jgi:RNA polymerase sigma factor (sigma-70 family)
MGERLGDTQLWVTVRDTAYTVLRRRGWTHEEADDAAQETALALQRELAKGKEIRNPAAWAATVANRRAVDLDRKAHMPHAHEVDMRESIGRFLADGAPTSMQAIQREQVGRFVEALSEEDLETAWLTAEGLKQAEIAELLGITEEGVRQRLKRMRKRLRERADELGVDVEVLEHPRPY